MPCGRPLGPIFTAAMNAEAFHKSRPIVAQYGASTSAASAFVSTNSICQGQQVAILWPLLLETKHHIFFAYTSFKWSNLAAHKAGVTVVTLSRDQRGRVGIRTQDW